MAKKFQWIEHIRFQNGNILKQPVFLHKDRVNVQLNVSDRGPRTTKGWETQF